MLSHTGGEGYHLKQNNENLEGKEGAIYGSCDLGDK